MNIGLRQRIIFLLTASLLLFAVSAAFAQEPMPIPKRERAHLKISGYGLLGNFELKRLLQSLDLEWRDRTSFDANFIEDSALIILSTLQRDGYLQPKVTAELTLRDGSIVSYEWETTIDPPLPRPFEARRVRYRIDQGILYRYNEIQVVGSREFTDRDVRGFFVERGVLLRLKQTRIYSPDRLERGIGNLTEALTRRGFENARVTATNIVQNPQTGGVDLTIRVEEGRKVLVNSIRTETFISTNQEPIVVEIIQTNAPYSRLWQQDFGLMLRTTNYHHGYPDTTTEISRTREEHQNGTTEIDLLARIELGEQIRIGEVIFDGLQKTKPSVVHRRVEMDPGDLLNRIEAEKGRHRLARLGVFRTVDLRYDVIDEHTRNVIYSAQEGKRLNVSLLFGYGSYELLRAGIEVEQQNVFGRAHHQRLRAVQSFKATTIDYLYTMPEFVGERVDVFINAFYLRREEVSFTREEFGAGAGASTFLDLLQSDFRASYNYQILSAEKIDVVEGPTNAAVGAIILDLRHDKRDSPLYPRRGYRFSGSLETASDYLGGEVNYARFETQASYHQPLDAGRWLHFGLSHGAILTLHHPSDDLPFNKRFFPGGDSSVRGFQFGEAAPRNAAGQTVGAETYTLGNLEFEQALTDKWSLITFVDAIGFARRVGNYPFNEYLVSTGAGIRWKTIIGPVRLEYGYNAVRRAPDPTGTLHFSLGFPF